MMPRLKKILDYVLIAISLFSVPSFVFAYHGNNDQAYLLTLKKEKLIVPPDMESILVPEEPRELESIDSLVVETLRSTCGDGIEGTVTRTPKGSFKVSCDNDP